MPELSESQLSNLESIIEASGEFSREAGVEFESPPLDNETVVIESGHQPNFLPHAGLFKKAFLTHVLKKRVDGGGKRAVALFGFPDYNLCTAKLLTQNRFPEFGKLGYEKIGFKIIEKDIWRRFDYLARPSKDEWERTIAKICSHYKKYPVSGDVKLRLSEVIELLEDCYKRAGNFPDINAFFISKLCNRIGIEACFFRYSDIQKKGVFIEQWKGIISGIERYNSIYNSSIERHKLDIPGCAADSLPFWYHCKCGAKVALLYDQGFAQGICRVCAEAYELDLGELEKAFRDMSPNAVARNIIFSEGMGTRIFVQGTGGSLIYGMISDDIARELGLNLPATVSWKSRDYYTGPAHEAALGSLARACRIKKEDILTEDLNRTIKDTKNEFEKRAAGAKEKGRRDEINQYEGDGRNLCTSVEITRAIFAATPSFVDILVSQGVGKVEECWAKALDEALNEPGKEQVMTRDIIYDDRAFTILRKVERIN
ncbi:MAG: hypothetical protein OIN66_16330 [Candidatus Methanoperedens sp.]|nr:hypothetical protein [Candidatus Methanoperedens sp.]